MHLSSLLRHRAGREVLVRNTSMYPDPASSKQSSSQEYD